MKEDIKLYCSNYINQIMTPHGWDTNPEDLPITNKIAPLAMDALQQIQNHKDGPKEGAA